MKRNRNPNPNSNPSKGMRVAFSQESPQTPVKVAEESQQILSYKTGTKKKKNSRRIDFKGWFRRCQELGKAIVLGFHQRGGEVVPRASLRCAKMAALAGASPTSSSLSSSSRSPFSNWMVLASVTLILSVSLGFF